MGIRTRIEKTRSMGETMTILMIAAIAAALVVASLIRRAGREECLVVTRHRRILRTASGSTTVAVPGFHEVLEWPTGQLEVAVVVRSRTLDEQDVRVLATAAVEIDPPRIGDAYVDPHAVLYSALERRIAEAVRARPAEWLTDDQAGLRSALVGVRVDGLVRGVVADVVIDEVDLLLHPGRSDHESF